MMENKLLLIDDDELFASRMQRVLERHGYEALTAGNSEEALQLAREHDPYSALLDLKLGTESGLNLIPELLSVNPNIRIIMLTGYGSISTAVQAINLGAKDYLVKPVDTQMILDALNAEPVQTKQEAPNAEPHTTKLKRLEWEHIQQTLKKNEGNISQTARELGMHRKTLQRKLNKKPIGE